MEGNPVIEHSIIKAKHYAYITIKQSPDLATFIRASRLFVNDPDYSATLHRICDFSQADLSHITQENFETYVKFALEEVTLAPGTKLALVAPGKNKVGIFKEFAENINAGTIRIFLQPEDAVEWIQE
ncbi:MAG: hypothetical protein WD002_00625 [Pseudomonadales bacterium]